MAEPRAGRLPRLVLQDVGIDGLSQSCFSLFLPARLNFNAAENT
jgi:hypothetical protein